MREDPVEEMTADGVRTKSGAFYPLDVLVLATGFDAVMGALTRIDIIGTDGRLLRDQWRNGPEAHLGIAIAGFPNLFYQTGPLSTGTLASMIQGNEIQTDWLVNLTLMDQGRKPPAAGATYKIFTGADPDTDVQIGGDIIINQQVFPDDEHVASPTTTFEASGQNW